MKILTRLPYQATSSAGSVHGENFTVKAFQIVARISVSARQVLDWDSRLPNIPAVLDTGNNYHFAIGESQLTRWAGMPLSSLPRVGTISERGNRIPLHAARLWLHPNVAHHTAAEGSEPFQLSIDEGIAVYPDQAAPRLPVLGLRALTTNRLQLLLDADNRQVHLRSPDWRTRLVRWIS
ncbi:MAG: hypothetical protein FJ271_32575 [Planctomycetes bacterium]|nr:hypothetical protein [Planctomycetota bacterium]